MCGAWAWGCTVPLMPDVASSFVECEECTKNLFQSNIRSSIFVIRPIKSCNVKIKQKSLLNQTKVKGVLVVGLQKHLQSSRVEYVHRLS